MQRFRPTDYEMKAYPIDVYPCKSKQAASIMLMIQNNSDERVAQFLTNLLPTEAMVLFFKIGRNIV